MTRWMLTLLLMVGAPLSGWLVRELHWKGLPFPNIDAPTPGTCVHVVGDVLTTEQGTFLVVRVAESANAPSVVVQDAELQVDLPDGLTVGHVYGWTATVQGATLLVPLGLLHAGEVRQVVIRLGGGRLQGGTIAATLSGVAPDGVLVNDTVTLVHSGSDTQPMFDAQRSVAGARAGEMVALAALTMDPSTRRSLIAAMLADPSIAGLLHADQLEQAHEWLADLSRGADPGAQMEGVAQALARDAAPDVSTGVDGVHE